MTRFGEISFAEPTLDASGVALSDLAHFNEYRRLDHEDGATLVATLAPTGAAGGGTITTTVTAPGSVGLAYYYVTAVDSSGNEGPSTPSQMMRWLPPAIRRLEITRRRPG